IFGVFFRNTPATTMRCGRTFRLARTHPAHAPLSGSETLLRSRSLADYTIDMHESEFSEATAVFSSACAAHGNRLQGREINSKRRIVDPRSRRDRRPVRESQPWPVRQLACGSPG